MSLPLFKGNKGLTGCLADFSFNSKDYSFYISFIQQTGYNESKHLPSFKGGERGTLKLTVFEVGGFIDTFLNNRETKGYHTNETGKTTYSVLFAEGKGFRFFVNKTDNHAGKETKFSLGITFAEAQTLVEFFRVGLSHILEQQRRDELVRINELKKLKEGNGSKSHNSNPSVDDEIEDDVESSSGVDDDDIF